MSEKCPYHDDYMRHLQSQDKAIEGADNKAQKALDKVDVLSGSHKETEIYTKELYKTVDRVVSKVDNLADKVAGLVTALTVNKNDTDTNTKHNKRGKDLAYDILKWVLLLALGVALGSHGQ